MSENHFLRSSIIKQIVYFRLATHIRERWTEPTTLRDKKSMATGQKYRIGNVERPGKPVIKIFIWSFERQQRVQKKKKSKLGVTWKNFEKIKLNFSGAIINRQQTTSLSPQNISFAIPYRLPLVTGFVLFFSSSSFENRNSQHPAKHRINECQLDFSVKATSSIDRRMLLKSK